MSYGTKVLVVGEQAHIRRFLRLGLNAHGYEVIETVSSEEAQSKCATETPALAILDLGLSTTKGQDLIAALRSCSQIPIIVLSERLTEAKRVKAIEHGADAYVIKPFGMGELMARMRAVLHTRAGDAGQSSEIKNGALSVDLARRRVQVDDADVKLTKKEFQLLSLLAVNAGRIVTHQRILKELWGPAHCEDTQHLRTYICHLRKKLRDDPAKPRFIETAPGAGYRLAQTGPAPTALHI